MCPPTALNKGRQSHPLQTWTGLSDMGLCYRHQPSSVPMRNLFIITLFALLSASKAPASGLQQFEFEIPSSFITKEYKSDLQNWRLSLLNSIGYNETKINEAVFLKNNIPLIVNGYESIGQVYQNKDVEHQFYVRVSNTIIDFKVHKIGTMGVSGMTNHPTPNGRMNIVLAPNKI